MKRILLATMVCDVQHTKEEESNFKRFGPEGNGEKRWVAVTTSARLGQPWEKFTSRGQANKNHIKHGQNPEPYSIVIV